MSYISGRWVHTSFLAATIFALAIVPGAEAQTGRVRRNTGGQAGSGAGTMHRGGGGYRNGMANQNNAAVARELHSTMRVLAQADHDYQGHRALAMKHVQTAIRHLVPAAAGRGQQSQAGSSVSNGAAAVANGNGAVAGGNGKQRLPQATSDQYLQQALQSLTTIHGQIMSGGTTPNHARAAVAVQNAARELKVALNIR